MRTECSGLRESATEDHWTEHEQVRPITRSHGLTLSDGSTMDRGTSTKKRSTRSSGGTAGPTGMGLGGGSLVLVASAEPSSSVQRHAFAAPRKRLVVDPYVAEIPRERQSSRLVVDDYGDAVGIEYRCSRCMRWTGPRCKGGCLSCRRWVYHKLRSDSEWLAARQARNRETRRQRLAENPEAREQERNREKRARKARLERDRERERALNRARVKRYRDKVQADAEKRARKLELRRMWYAERAMREGRELRRTWPLVIDGGGDYYVPLAPLVRAVERTLNGTGDLKEFCEAAGMDPRVVLAWRLGQRKRTPARCAERVFRALDCLWFDVYSSEVPEGEDPEVWAGAVRRAQELWGDASSCTSP